MDCIDDRESEADLMELVTDEMLVGARFITPAGGRPKASPYAEARRQEALQRAREKYVRHIAMNREAIQRLRASKEYGLWFEVFNGAEVVAEDLAVLGQCSLGFGATMQGYFQRWKDTAQRAAAKKGLLWEMLHAAKSGRERRIIRIRLATPAWVDYDKIKAMYVLRNEMTAATGISHHVDHIVPLAARLATGLHVHDNMQVITAAENLKKMNKFKPWD